MQPPSSPNSFTRYQRFAESLMDPKSVIDQQVRMEIDSQKQLGADLTPLALARLAWEVRTVSVWFEIKDRMWSYLNQDLTISEYTLVATIALVSLSNNRFKDSTEQDALFAFIRDACMQREAPIPQLDHLSPFKQEAFYEYCLDSISANPKKEVTPLDLQLIMRLPEAKKRFQFVPDGLNDFTAACIRFKKTDLETAFGPRIEFFKIGLLSYMVAIPATVEEPEFQEEIDQVRALAREFGCILN